jgi:predicted TPR repeat methyltransferase
MLDLGCGTGLAGAAFAPFADCLVGVDLSPAMIARAEAKGLYRRLVTADLIDALAAEKSEQKHYDLAVAADVFVYVNELGRIVAAVTDILTPDGLFAFTVETHAGEGIKLLPTLRYAHAEAYVRTVLREVGLAVVRIDRKPIRSEKAVPVDSLVIVAQPSTDR